MNENNILNNAKNLTEQLDKDKKVNIKTSDQFREQLAEFIIQQTKKIQGEDVVLNAITNEFLTKVKMHEVEPEELRRWYVAVSSSKSDYARALLDIFRPSGQNSTPLLAPKENEESTDVPELDSKQLNSVNKLFNMMSAMAERVQHKDDPVANPPAGSEEKE